MDLQTMKTKEHPPPMLWIESQRFQIHKCTLEDLVGLQVGRFGIWELGWGLEDNR